MSMPVNAGLELQSITQRSVDSNPIVHFLDENHGCFLSLLLFISVCLGINPVLTGIGIEWFSPNLTYNFV